MMCFLATLLLLMFGGICRGFNVDTKFPISYSGPEGSYFGYTVALHRNSQGPLVLVGAPKANSTTVLHEIYEPGALFRCDISNDGKESLCKEIALIKEENTTTVTARVNNISSTEKRDSMWLGVSLDVRQNATQNDAVVCAHLWKTSEYYALSQRANGICYVIDTDLNEDSVEKLTPLEDSSTQYELSFEHKEYLLANGQAGITAAFSEDGSHLVLGAPGILSWTGSFVSYPISDGSNTTAMYGYPFIPYPSNEFDFYSYFGYSVSSGKFYESQPLLYAIGAPRDAGKHGMVYIVEAVDVSSGSSFFDLPNPEIIIQQRKLGIQFGEYFGASVLGVDLNGDSFADLLVGAPLHSLESGGDEGKIYVYISDGKDLQKQTEIAGDRKPNARFGTAIANIGDINQDGFPAIAIGAPYEDGQGAVYIYRCDRFGLVSRYEQRIEAAAIDRRLSGFGIHISRGLDIDYNGYPDVLVGSYASANAVLLRSRPIIRVFPKMTFNPKKIYVDVPCENSLVNLTCVQIVACLYYTGEHVPSSLEFTFTVLIQDQRHRGFFEQDNPRDAMSRKSMVLSIQNTECIDFRMFLYPGIKDVISPIQVQFSHELKPPAGSKDTFDKTFPVYHRSSQTKIASKIPFHTGCGKADECRSNLYISSIRVSPPENVQIITLGAVSYISLEITIGNKGEPAYLSELHVYLPPEISTINQGICESGDQQHNATLICDIGNPLKNNTQVKVNIKLDTTKIPPRSKELKIVLEVVTISSETDRSDNTKRLHFFPETIYDVGVTGVPSQDQIIDDGNKTLSPIINHAYTVRNHGPGPVQKINFTLNVPYELETSDGLMTFLSFTGLDAYQRTPFSVPVLCDATSLNITPPYKQRKGMTDTRVDDDTIIIDSKTRMVFIHTNLPDRFGFMSLRIKKFGRPSQKENRNKTDTPKDRSIRISCDSQNIRCVNLRCSASSFSNPRKYAEISVSFHINYTVLDEYLGPWNHLELITDSSIKVDEGEVMKQNIYPDAAKVKTDFLHKGFQHRVVPPKVRHSQKKAPPVILFVGFFIGISLLIFIVMMLAKFGFFIRKEKEALKRMISDCKKVEQVTVKNEDHSEIAEQSVQ